MKYWLRSRTSTAPARRTGSRLFLELLESRLQPGSIITTLGAGWSSWADGSSLLQPSTQSSAQQISVLPSETQTPSQLSTPAETPGDNLTAAIQLVPAIQSDSSTPSQPLVDAFTPDWVNGDLASFPAGSQPHFTPVLPAASSSTSTSPTRSVPVSAGAAQSPVGVVAPPTPVQLNSSSNASGGGAVSAPVGATHLPMPTATADASAAHPLGLHEVALNPATTPIVGGIKPDMTTENFSTYLGGPGQDGLTGVATDNEGNIYVAGYLEASPGTTEIYVASINSTGTQENWEVAYTGGVGPTDVARGIAVVDNTANGGDVDVYITGSISNGSGSQAPTDGFVALLDGSADGAALNFQDTGPGDADGIAVDTNTGFVFVSGTSTDPNTGAKSIMTTAYDLPLATQEYTVNIPLQDANGNNVQGFVSGAQSIALDPQDNVYIMGTMVSAGGTDTSPVLVAYNGFSSKLLWQPINFPNPTFGGSGYGSAVVFQEFSLYVTGTLYDSNDGTPSNSDLLLARVPQSGGTPYFDYTWQVADNNTRDGDWTGNGLIVNANNEPIVAGAALDPTGSSSFAPTKGLDVQVTHFGASGSTTQAGTNRPENTFGGSGTDMGNAVIPDPSNPGSVIVVGTTGQNPMNPGTDDFPTTPNALQPTYGGGPSDGFVASVPV
jgi:hypothetical protein